MMMLFYVDQLLCFLMFASGNISGMYVNKANNVDSEKKLDLEQSWENWDFLRQVNGNLELEDESNGELFALREQSVKEARVKRQMPDDERGSGSPTGSESTGEGRRMAKIIAEFEGIKTKVYRDSKRLKTVGVGFNLQQSDARKIFEKYIPNVSFDDVVSGKKGITEEQALDLFKNTLEDKVKTTKRLFPNFENYPEDVKIALVNGVFRGEFTRTQKTVNYINSCQWDKVANEYLDNDGYRNSKPGKNGGIKKRMDYNANIFRNFAKKQKKN